MAKKPITFSPVLLAPVGINNYSGKVFRCFTRGDTLPFKFTIKNEDGVVPPDIADWKVVIVMADSEIPDSGCNGDQQVIEVEIPLINEAEGVFEGHVKNFRTQDLPAGLIYALAKYITAPGGTVEDPIPGSTFIMDMCQLEVYPNLTFPTL